MALRKAKAKLSPNSATDPERSAAMKGNKNASRGGSKGQNPNGTWGARTGVVGAMFGPIGNVAAGALVGAAKHGAGSERAHRRVIKSSAIANGVAGSIIGGAIGYGMGGRKGALIGAASMGAADAAIGAGLTAVGRWVGKGLSSNKTGTKKSRK